MANVIRRFLRSKSCLTPIQRLTTPSLTTFFQKKPCIESVIEKSDPVSVANPVITISGNESDQPMRFYPSFAMGYFMNSSMIQCPDLAETVSSLEEKDEKEELVIYADSVKKKRKKRMNKHKYRKLRKKQRKKKSKS